MSNTAVRLLTGFIGAPIIVAILYLSPFPGYFALAGGAMLIAAFEFFGMTHPDDRTGRWLGTGLTLAVFLALVVTRYGHVHAPIALWTFALMPVLVLLVGLGRPKEIPNALPRATALVFGPLYLGATMGALAVIRTYGAWNEGAGLALVTLCTAWASDTTAYFAGRTFKGPKLYPAVSPGKTWSGALGGLAGSVLSAVIAHFTFFKTLPLVTGMLVAGAAGVLGQTGDLAESVLKRSAGVKDSGGILPGHGGILDRIDALVFAAMVVLASLELGILPFTRQG